MSTTWKPRSAAATTVSHFVYPCPKEKKSALLALLMKEHKIGRAHV